MMELLVNTSKSVVKWKGEKVTGSHEGVINIKSANFLLMVTYRW